MEYHEAVNFLFDLRRYTPRKGVDATRDLLAHLGNPEEGLTVVQVAGSNGKGSTARMAERVLRETGLDVGLFTSPHLSDLRERVRVNGRKVSKRAVCEFVEAAEGYVTEEAAKGTSPTFFEATTALAVWAFARAEVDVAVLEVGIGGRYDATSAVTPTASCVTSVTLEHADLLGETVEEIADDKAHVVAEANPLVTAAEGGALAAIEAVAGEVVRVGTDADADVRVAYGGRDGLEGRVTIDASDVHVETNLPLVGAYQACNAGVAAALCRQITDVSKADLARGLRNAHWPGRFEVMGRDPLVVLDGAHNPGGCAGLSETLAEFDYSELHLVFGAMSDKDHAGMVANLPRAAHVFTCRPEFSRAETAATLAAAFEGHADEVHRMAAVPDALAAALATAKAGDCVLVTGSLFTVAEARERWTRLEIPKAVPDLPTAERVLADADVPPETGWRLRATGVHRVLKTRVQPHQAERLERALLEVGGECAVSGVDGGETERVDVVLMGTLAQFERLVAALDGEPHGLGGLGASLGAALGLDGGETRGYPWETGTAVMGILNVTPDSFHDGGRFETHEAAVAQAEAMVAAGADIIDVGGESTRPGAETVPVADEVARVVPVIEAIADLDALVSVDTRKAAVARAALDAGADILNDVSGLEDPEMRLVAAEYDVPVVVMHSIEAPVDPSTEVEYDDVVEDTLDALVERVLLAEKAGLERSKIIVDPGLGFGKSAAESFELLGRVGEFRALGCPVLVGHSHKSMFRRVGGEPGDALFGTVAGTAVAAMNGADIVRVHDVAENVAAVRTVEASRAPREE
jgi:dihydropteroate synthase